MNINTTEIVCFRFIIAYFLIKEIQLFEIEYVIIVMCFFGIASPTDNNTGASGTQYIVHIIEM
jgi:hypothetical protein